jgi:pre-mRNA-splicing helicase BRR2
MISEPLSVYEVIVSRMRYISTQVSQKIQIIGLATSVADYMDMARWIGCQPANAYNFHPNVRANPMEIVIQAFEQPHRKSRLLAMH